MDVCGRYGGLGRCNDDLVQTADDIPYGVESRNGSLAVRSHDQLTVFIKGRAQRGRQCVAGRAAQCGIEDIEGSAIPAGLPES